MKLGKRLTAIDAAVTSDVYDHIWDCCCDHGLLGFQLLEADKAPTVHFVDIVPQLLIEIEQKLKQFYSGENQWQVHCVDVGQLPLKTHTDEKHLIIIAGIGGQLLIELLNRLLPIITTINVEFILSPVHHNYQLRQFLVDNHFALIDEFITVENNRYYEVMHLNYSLGDMAIDLHDCVSLVGNKMWDFKNSDHQYYLQQTIEHYQRIAKNPNMNVDEIISAYQQLNTL